MMILFTFLFINIMRTFSQIYGIDVSKDTLDLHFLSPNDSKTQRINNTDNPIQAWIKTIEDVDNTLCVVEATGAYSQKLLHYLCQAGVPASRISPLRSHGYMQALGITSKDDKQAAYALACMGKLDLPLYKEPSPNMQERKQLLAGIQALSKQRQQLRNQLHAFDHQIIYAPAVTEALNNTLKAVEEQIRKLKEQLQQVNPEEYQHQFKLLTSIIGIGPKSAHLLLTSTGGLQHFERASQLSKFVGLVPFSHSSGSSVRKKGRMTKRGNSDLRSCLYMAARSARKHNLACKDLYERLRAKGKPHKQAMVAVMNKLVKQAHGVVLSGVPFDNEHFKKYLEK